MVGVRGIGLGSGMARRASYLIFQKVRLTSLMFIRTHPYYRKPKYLKVLGNIPYKQLNASV